MQKTQERKVILLDFGKVIFNETIKHCATCKSIFGSEKLRELVPEYSNFSFEVIEFVGRNLFEKHSTESEVVVALEKRNVMISPSEVSVLGKKFILYLAQAHKDKEAQIKELIQKKGGYIIHLDGTCEGESPHLFCAVEEVLGLVLISRKIASESADAIASILRELVAAYGNPLGVVCDMSKGIIGAVEEVLAGVPIFICHFHWLRDIGKDLLKNDHDPLAAVLRDFDVKPTLSKFARDLRNLIRSYPVLAQHLESPVVDFFNQKLPEEILVYLLVEWIQDYPKDLDGYGYPFDRANIAQVERMKRAYEHLQKLQLKPESRMVRVEEFLKDILGDFELQRSMSNLEKKVQHFDRLREIMRMAPPEGKNGLNDDGKEADMPTMKKELEKFVDLQEIQNAGKTDVGYKKMLAQIAKYKDKLFTDGLEVTDATGKKQHIQPERTNNLMERFFRDEKRGHRKRTGYKSMGRILKTMLAETPYVKNLENQEYLQVILNGKKTLAERFAEINGLQVRKAMKKHLEDQDRLCPCVKRIIEKENLLQSIVEAHSLL